MKNGPDRNKTYTVLELNAAIKQVLDFEFPDYIWICGEIQDFRVSPSRFKKHVYFNLVQKHPELDQVLAQISTALFQNTLPKIERRLETGDIADCLKNGLEVKLLCKVNFYPKQGRCNLIIADIDPAYTLGKLAQAKQKILKELKAKGALERNKLLKIPVLPLNIGLITSHNSAAYHDFINQLEKSGYGFNVLLIDCHMQGNLVESDIQNALSFLNKHEEDKIDLIAVTRGGGASADLGWFDSKQIALQASESKYPVLAAIGHQINVSILELASHSFFKTPTDLASFIVCRVDDFLTDLNNMYDIINETAKMLLEAGNKNLEMTTSRISNLVHMYFSDHKESLARQKALLTSLTASSLANQNRALKDISRELINTANLNFKLKKDFLKKQEEKLQLLKPENILKRGFSITLKEKKPLKDKKEVNKGDLIETVLYNGKISSKVQ